MGKKIREIVKLTAQVIPPQIRGAGRRREARKRTTKAKKNGLQILNGNLPCSSPFKPTTL